MCIFGGGGGINTSSAPTGDYGKYVQDNPDLAQAYASGTGLARGKTMEQFGREHYVTHGQGEGRTLPGGVADLIDQGKDQANQAQNDTATLITNLTKGFQDQIDAINKGNQDQLAEIGKQNTSLTQLIADQQGAFTKAQEDLLKGQEQTAKRFEDALKQLMDSQNASGQAAKKPNYARALAKNKEINSGGLSSTLLTGSGGVATGSLPLGQTSLLGA